jgi:phospholipase D1/2
MLFPAVHGLCSLNWAGVSVQVVRSVSEWSLGMSSEPSVGEAYCTLIDAAQHFIYIENQFFISSNAGSGITNTVVDHLVNKIVAMAAAR